MILSNDPKAHKKNHKKDSPVIVAFDFDNQQQALELAQKLTPDLCKVKIGKELFTTCGPQIVEQIQNLGFDVFLDLKFHDIPNTCAKAVKAAAELGVWMVNVHASGGERMMAAAKNELAHFKTPPKLIAVTVLTSMEQADLQAVGIMDEPQKQVERLAKSAKQCQLDGVVCSAQEIGLIKQICGSEFLTVTPGIRPKGSENQDQRRIMTPEQAMQAGVDYMVIGRPITQAQDSSKACENIVRNIKY